ncbi:hypothetical protein [Chitinibacter fontanus]|nr:hypothetical protein [Chitinibacter fontanus]
MTEAKAMNTQKPTPAELKKQQEKPLAERLAGEKPFDWIKLKDDVATK